jgi:hypothetical protein
MPPMPQRGTLTTSLTEQLSSYSKRYPSPTRAVALAALESLWQSADAASAIAVGLPENVARPWLPPLGVLPRMRFKACGWFKRGDSFVPPDSADWYGGKYTHPLWEPLHTWASVLMKHDQGGTFNWDQELADGKPKAIAGAMERAASELADMRKVNADLCDAYLTPIRRDITPPANTICLANIELANHAERNVRKVMPRQPSLASVPWWVWIGGAYLLTRRRR